MPNKKFFPHKLRPDQFLIRAMELLNHRGTDITWEAVSGVIRGIYIGASVVLLTYFIVAVLDYIDVLNINSWVHILVWTFFCFFSLVLAIVHAVLNYKTSEKSPSLSTTIIQNLCVTLLTTLALFIVYLDSDRRIDSTTMTSGMEQFFERRKHFFLIILMISSMYLFANSMALVVLYRK